MPPEEAFNRGHYKLNAGKSVVIVDEDNVVRACEMSSLCHIPTLSILWFHQCSVLPYSGLLCFEHTSFILFYDRNLLFKEHILLKRC